MTTEDRKAHFQKLLIEKIYSGKVLNNAHRGDLVEMMVLSALGPDWRFVGLGWNLWDLQRGTGPDRVRIQVKQCAARQRWGQTKSMTCQFPWSERRPKYWDRDHPNEHAEDHGRYCELFVVGIHSNGDEETRDQLDVSQWAFMIVPTCDLDPQKTFMRLDIAIKKWTPVAWEDLKDAVETQLQILTKA